MEENKIVFKSIDEQLAEDERREAAEQKSASEVVEKTTTTPRRGRKKLRLKKSVRRTVGSLMLATSLVVAAIPTGGVSATDLDVYAGSKATAPELSAISPKSKAEYDALSTKVANIAHADCIGGFPIIPEIDDQGNIKKTEIGDRGYFVVDDKRGYSKDIRPIYALDSTGRYVDKYLETIGTDDTYNIPDGKLNLVNGYVGYVNDTTEGVTDKEYKDRLYRTTVFKFSVDGYDLFGKKIEVFDQVTVEMCVVEFYDRNGVLYTRRNVIKGKKLSEAEGGIPEVPDVAGATSKRWSLEASTIITDTANPTRVDAIYEGLPATSPSVSPMKGATPNIVNEVDSENLDDLTLLDSNGENTEENNNPPIEDETVNNNSTTLSEEESENAPSTQQTNEDESNQTDTVIVENVDVPMEESEAEFGLNGVLLWFYPNDTDPNKREYKEDPTETYYVCDEYASISNICDNAFEDTKKISTVDFPSNIVRIGNCAFKGSHVGEISLANGLSSIGASAFEDCAQLKSIKYQDGMGSFIIGDKGFANCPLLDTFATDSESGFVIPASLSQIGTAAFYATGMNELDFKKNEGCTVGDYAFARCDSLGKANLDSVNPTITNLKDVEGLFRECHNLTDVIMPSKFLNGRIKKDTFGSCNNLNLIVFKNSTSGFQDGEFDSTQIIVEGPEPNMDVVPESNSAVWAYHDCLKADPTTDASNNYTYRYRASDSEYYDYCNVKSFNTGTVDEKNDFVFRVRNDGMIVAATDRPTINPSCDLVINDTVGENDIFINAIDHDVFKNNTSIVNLTLPSAVHSVGVSAFESCTKLESVIVTTNNTDQGTDLKDRAFYGNNKLKTVMYKHNGDGLCAIRSECFKDCGSLEEVRFFAKEDGDYQNGSVDTGTYDINKYARFSTKGIAEDAFEYDSRMQPIKFFGPMTASYTPYLFAIGKGGDSGYTSPGNISSKEIYIEYRTENPRNLMCTYVAKNDNASKPNNPVYVAIDSADSELLNKYSEELLDSVPHYNKKQGKFSTPAGVYLMEYPNITSWVDHGVDSVHVYDLIDKDPRTGMESAIVHQTENITVPYGIDFIDYAESKIEDGSYAYFAFDKGNSSHFENGTSMFPTSGAQSSYHMFAYVNGLKTVTFDNESAWYIPAYAFEGPYVDDPEVIIPEPEKVPQSVETITFNQDVKLMGELPFFCADPEDKYALPRVKDYNTSFPHQYRSPSQLSTIFFTNANDISGTASKDNLVYSFINGIVKSNNGSVVTVEEILPGRGFLNRISSTTIGTEINGVNELADVNRFAPYAARDCDSITQVNLQAIKDKQCEIPEGCFYDCDALALVELPNIGVGIKNYAFGSITKNLTVNCNQETGQYNIEDDAFAPGNKVTNTYPTVTMYYHELADQIDQFVNKPNAEPPQINERHPNVFAPDPFEYLPDIFKVTFYDRDNVTVLANYNEVKTGTQGRDLEPDAPTHEGVVFEGWKGVYPEHPELGEVTDRVGLKYTTIFTAQYGNGDKKRIVIYFNGIELTEMEGLEPGTIFTQAMYDSILGMVPDVAGYKKVLTGAPLVNTPITKDYDNAEISYVPITSPTPTVTPTPTPTSTPSSSSSSKTSSKSSSSSSSASSSSSSSTAYPVYVSSQDTGAGAPATVAGIGSTVFIDEGSGGSGSGGGSTGKKGKGNATVISTTGGISDTGKMSATVNGSSDNYVIKITQTPEADEMGLQALHGAYGDDISAIRYLPFDISLYDSTGTNKISPVPEGVSISLTMPIPDDLAIYGGNAKIASTAGGVLDRMEPRFTVINGVPCMTYTCTHFSPYMVWVDTNNLTEAGIADMTPKTADGIHPKWFLCFGLAAIAVVMFLKKDPEEYLKKAA